MTNAVPVVFTLLVVCSLPAMAVIAAGPDAGPSAPLATASDEAVSVEATFDQGAIGDWGTMGYQSTIDRSTTADAIAAQTSIENEEANTTSRLQPEGPTQRELVRSGPDLGSTLASGDVSMRNDWDVFGVERAIEGETSEEQAAILDDAFDGTAERVDALADAEAAAIDDYAEGTLSANGFVHELKRLDREASALADTMESYAALADDVPGYSVRIDDELSFLESYQGPATVRLAETIRGETAMDAPARVTVAESGLVVEAIHGSTYLREALVSENRDPTAGPTLESFSDVEAAAADRYPWVQTAEKLAPVSISENAPYALYRYDVVHEQGELLTYWDVGTGEAFREHQQLTLGELPRETIADDLTNETHAVTVEATPEDGPMAVTVVDADTGDPIDEPVAVDGDPIGTTGSDGVGWFLPPTGSFELTVGTGDEAITTTIDPE